MDVRRDLEHSDALYELYGKPLEAEHWGEFIAISRSGQTLLGSNLYEVAKRASEELGRDIHLFKVGPRAVGMIG